MDAEARKRRRREYQKKWVAVKRARVRHSKINPPASNDDLELNKIGAGTSSVIKDDENVKKYSVLGQEDVALSDHDDESRWDLVDEGCSCLQLTE